MPAITPWDVRIVSATTLASVAYVGNWHTLQFGDSLSDPGSGRLEVDYDEPWLSAFYTANSKYPWEGNYAVQIHRAGTLVYTFLIEEAEIEYAGNRRRAVIAGRGLGACLEWAVVLPEKFDEGLEVDGVINPDALVGPMSRAFGSTHADQSDLEDIAAGQTLPNHGMILAESRFGPKYKAFGGGAFVHLFKEADLGVGTTTARWLDTDSNNDGNGTAAWANVTLSTLPGGGGSADRDGDSVDWPLSLDSNMTTEQYDSEGVEWSHATYEDDDTQWVFEVPSGQDLLKTLKNCASKTANAQWRVAPDGKVSIAKQLGENKSGVVLLTVPNAVRSANSFRRTDLRTTMFLSNGFVMEKVDDATAVSAYGRREAFVKYDNVHGEANVEVARQSLNEVKGVLDNFSFQYIETDNTQAWLDFGIADVVRIEYTPGSYENRQVVGISANLTPSSFQVEITIGDVVENIIGRLEQVEETEQYTYQISQSNFTSSAVPNPPINVVATPQSEGRDRRAVVTFDQPRGWENEIATFEVEVTPTANTSRRYTMARTPDRTSTQQEVVIHALASGAEDTEYEVRARSISRLGYTSDYSTGANFDVEADPDFETDLDGTIIDTSPDVPDDVANVVVRGMLNAVLVSFNDLNDGSNLAMQANRGHYEIEISNATSFNSTTGNEWTRVIGGSTSGVPGTASQTFIVPSGEGFICAGLKSEAGGRDHWVRVRAVDWNKEVSENWTNASVAYWPVSLDTDDESQTGVWIGTDTIGASFIKAGVIDATHISAGTINASLIDAGQVLTTAIRMPQPANAENATPDGGDNSSEEAATFNIDKDGNMWWGDYDTITLAQGARTSWVDATGDSTFLGNIASDSGGADGDLFATGNLGNARIVIGDNNTNLGFGGSSGGYGYLLGFTGHADEAIPGHAVFTYEDEGNPVMHRYGAAYLVAPRFHGGSTDGEDDYLGATNDRFKYAGVRLRDPKISHHVHEGTVPNNNSTANTIRLAATASSTNDIYNDHTIHVTISGGVQSRTITDYVGSTKIATVSPNWDTIPQNTATYKMSGFGEALLVHPADMDYMGIVSGPYPEGAAYGTYSEVMGVVTAPGGFRIKNHAIAPGAPGGLTLDPGTPATGSTNVTTSRNKLWNDGGTIMWGATDLTAGGSSYSWNLGLEEIEDGDIVSFSPTSQSGTNLAYFTQGVAFGVNVIEVTATKTITTRTDTGRDGLVIETASSPSTGVHLELNDLSDTDVTSGTQQYIPWSTAAFGMNLQYKTDIEQLGVFIAGLSDVREACDNRQLLLASGSQAAPAYSFSGDSHSGIWRSADNEISFGFSNSLRATMNLDGLSMVGGDATDPGYHFLSDEGTGMFRPATYAIGFSTNETERVRIDSDGNLMVGYTTSTYKLKVNGTSWFNGYTYHASGGKAYPAFSPWSTYNATYAADLGTTGLRWRNLYVDNVDELSDIKAKSNIANAAYGLDFVKQLRPVTFNMDGATGRGGARTHHGFIAQEIETLLGDAADRTALWTNGLSEAQPETDGPDGSTVAAIEEEWNQGLRYSQFIPILTKAIQELEARIAVLEG